MNIITAEREKHDTEQSVPIPERDVSQPEHHNDENSLKKMVVLGYQTSWYYPGPWLRTWMPVTVMTT